MFYLTFTGTEEILANKQQNILKTDDVALW